jgi:hypothetical protein
MPEVSELPGPNQRSLDELLPPGCRRDRGTQLATFETLSAAKIISASAPAAGLLAENRLASLVPGDRLVLADRVDKTGDPSPKPGAELGAADLGLHEDCHEGSRPRSRGLMCRRGRAASPPRAGAR